MSKNALTSLNSIIKTPLKHHGLHEDATYVGPVRAQQQWRKRRCAGSVWTVLDTEGLITCHQIIV